MIRGFGVDLRWEGKLGFWCGTLGFLGLCGRAKKSKMKINRDLDS